MLLKGKTVVLALSGSIAAYKIVNLARMLKKLGADVQVLMTRNATEFITPLTFEELTGNKCLVDTFDRNFQYNVEHVALAKRADVVLAAPASANVIGKIAGGIADDADEEAGESYAALFTDSPNYAIRECRDFLKNFAWKEPVFPAGTAARYCNCSYVLLGMAVEAVSGENYRDYFAKHIFEPAGMSRTAFLSMEEINANTAEGYESVWDEAGRFAGYRKNIYAFPPRGTPDGGAYTTTGDLCRFFEAVREGRILGRDTAESFLRPHCLFTSPEPRLGVPGLYAQNGYGLEFLMLPGEETPFCIGKDGQNPGVSAYVTYYPQSDSTLVLLANQDCNVWEMTREVQREMLRQTGLIPGFDR